MKTQDVLKLIEKEKGFPKDVAVMQTSSGDFIGFMPVCSGYRRDDSVWRIRNLMRKLGIPEHAMPDVLT